MYKLLFFDTFNQSRYSEISHRSTDIKLYHGKCYHKVFSKSLSRFERFLHIIKFIGILLAGATVVPIFLPCYRKRFASTYKNTKITDEIHYKEVSTPHSYGLEREKCKGIWTKVWSSDLRCNPERDQQITTLPGLNARVESWKKRYEVSQQRFSKSEQEEITPPLGFVNFGGVLPSNFSLWMGGISIVASYESERLKLKNLHVCKTIEAMQKGIQDCLSQPGNVRAAFIIGTSGRYTVPRNFPNHKLAICVERHEGLTRIAILEPAGGVTNIDPKTIEELPPNYDKESFSIYYYIEHLLKHLLDLNLGNQCSIYLTEIQRERLFGCGIFAFEGAFAFLRRGDFFYRIQNDCIPKTFGGKPIIFGGISLYSVRALPPEFMIGTQSCSQLTQYCQERPQEAQEPLPGRSQKTLVHYQRYWKKVEAPGKKEHGKLQNHYIANVWNKHMEIVLRAMELFSAQELKAAMAPTLLT